MAKRMVWCKALWGMLCRMWSEGVGSNNKVCCLL